jgi:uncharacterized membrane protein
MHMREPWSFIKTTLLGGVLFLLPIATILVILVKAGEIAVKAADPVADMLPYSKALSIIIVYTAGAVLIALLAFLAGLFARSLSTGKLVAWLEERILMRFPPYAAIRSVSQNIAGIDDDHGLKPVLVRVENGWQVGFEVEPAGADSVTVFMPEAHNPTSGVVQIIANERISHIDASMHDVLKCLKRSGRGLHAFHRFGVT